MQFTVPTGDIQKSREIVTLIKKYASDYSLEASTKDGDIYNLSFKSTADEEEFKAETAELLKMS